MDVAEKKKTLQSPYQKYAQTPAEARIPVKNEVPKRMPQKEEPQKGITPLKMFLGFMMAAALMIVWIWETSNVRQGLTEIERMKDQRLEIEKANEAIQTEITRMSGFERIQKIAKEQLKMVPSTEKPGVIFLEDKILQPKR